jgi:hypothetical protein
LNWIEQLLLWITYFNVYPGGLRMNILGVFWAVALIYLAARRFSWHFTDAGWERPAARARKYLWIFAMVLFGIIAVFMFQIVTDDFITVPISLAFGSWKVLVPGRGEFSLLKLIAFKWDNYAVLAVTASLFYISGVLKFYHFTKVSLFWLSLTVGSVVIVSMFHVFSFMQLSGYERLTAFWFTYPWFRIFTGFMFSSIIKKPGGSL